MSFFFPTVGKIDRGDGGGNEASTSRHLENSTGPGSDVNELRFYWLLAAIENKKGRQKKRLSISRSDDDDVDDDNDDDDDVSAQLVRPKRSMMEKASLSSFKFSVD